MIFIGIDVGVTGAVGAIDGDGSFIACEDIPITNYGKFKWPDGLRLLALLGKIRDGREARVYVEYVAPMPKFGCIAAASAGRCFGAACSTVQIAALPLELVSPQKWKKALNVTSDKDTTLGFARSRWPLASLDRKLDHNRAESLCIAEYGRRFNAGQA